MTHGPAATVGPPLTWCGHYGHGKAPMPCCGHCAILQQWHGHCGEWAASMAAVLSSWPLFCQSGHGSGYCGHYGHSMTTMAVVQPLWPWCGHYGRGAAIMTVAWPLWLLHGPYGRGATHMAVVRPQCPWYGHNGCGAAVMAVVPLLWPSFGPGRQPRSR
jgi:hypothetical protein